MPTIEDRTQTVRSVVALTTGRATYIADSGFIQPNTRYCTVKLIRHQAYQHDVVEDTDGFHQKVRGLASFDFSVQAIGGDEAAGTGAVQALRRFVASLRADLPREAFLREEIGIGAVGEVTDISIVVAGRIEDRAAMIFTIIASCEEVFDFDSATSAEMTVEGDVIIAPPVTPDCPVGG